MDVLKRLIFVEPPIELRVVKNLPAVPPMVDRNRLL